MGRYTPHPGVSSGGNPGIGHPVAHRHLADPFTDLARLGFSRADDVSEPEDHAAALSEVMSVLVFAVFLFGAPYGFIVAVLIDGIIGLASLYCLIRVTALEQAQGSVGEFG